MDREAAHGCRGNRYLLRRQVDLLQEPGERQRLSSIATLDGRPNLLPDVLIDSEIHERPVVSSLRRILDLTEPVESPVDEPSVVHPFDQGLRWELVELDWRRRLAYVVPVGDRGRSRWIGSGPPLSFTVCRAMRDVLCGDDPPALLSSRAALELASLRAEYEWATRTSTSLVRTDGRARWWTFAGTLANYELRWRLRSLADGSRGTDELSIPVREGMTLPGLRERLGVAVEGEVPVDPQAVEGLKFAECLPASVAESVVRGRAVDGPAVAACCSERVNLASR